MADCWKCAYYESGDPDVGLPSGCTSEHLYDDNGDAIPGKEDEIIPYILTDKECPWMNRITD